MRKGIAISAAAVAALAATAVPAAPAAAAAPGLVRGPDGVTINVGTVNGSGCPPGSATVALSEDREAFTVSYSQYLVQVGGNSKPTDSRKNCLLSLIVHVPQGFTYAIASTDHRGFASLQPGAAAQQLASYYFQGNPKTTVFEHQIPSPTKANWQFTDPIEIASMVWKPCGEERNFNINTELRADVGASDPSKVSFATIDSTDGHLKTTYHFSWKKCPKPNKV